ncbi:unnamed protein product, partial [Tetraodon nigroviridis]
GGMPPTPQAVQIAGQKQNQQQYDPSKGPPVQNAASLHTPPPQLPGRMAQGGLPIAGLPMALSQQAQLVETAQAGGHLQAQVKVPAGGSVLATVNPHTQIQAQLQQQMQPALHLQLQPQQQQSQAVLQSGQAVRLHEEVAFFKVFVPHILTQASFALCSLQTVALARPTVESNPPVQRIVTNSIPMTTMTPGPISVPNSVPTPHVTSPLRTVANINPSAHDRIFYVLFKESQVHRRISELRKEGQWSASRLPKLVEASRPKSQWDYLLEEMQWMAADFAQERRWKEAAAKKVWAEVSQIGVEDVTQRSLVQPFFILEYVLKCHYISANKTYV